MKFLKDIILKSGGKIDALSFPQPHFSFLKSPQIFAVVLFPWPWSIHFALTYTDAHSYLGYQSFICDQKPFLGNIAYAIRLFFKQN